jgi:hypothetical protein
MRSNASVEFIDLEEAISVTPIDVAMLEKVRAIPLSAQAYLEFLQAFIERHPPETDTAAGREPFTLA